MDTPLTALPLVDGDPCERADAARNRAAILAAAERLVAERGVEHVSMEAIASEAGVGKGTLFRRFGGRVGLMHALLDERERALQEEIIRGAPPLGPGAPAAERIVAFGRRVLEHLDAHGDLLLAAETGRWVRFTAPVYTFYRTHLVTLIREAAPEADAEYLADALLAPLGADFHLFLRRGREMTLERLQTGYEETVRRLLVTPAAVEAAAPASRG
jgi:AcrR family transcriptional regulator